MRADHRVPLDGGERCHIQGIADSDPTAGDGSFAAQLLGLPYVPLLNFDAEGYHVIVNATPVGRDDNAAPFKLETLADEAVVIDLVYGSRPTPLVSNSLGLGRTVIDGRDVLLTQVRRQFQIMTGRQMSADALLVDDAAVERILRVVVARRRWVSGSHQ